jgi:hypothetical protein
MPSQKPRVQVLLKAHQFELISRWAALQGASRSSVVAGLIEAVEPVLERVVVVLEAASKAQGQLHGGLRQSAERMEADLQPIIAEVLSQVDMFVADVEGSLPKEVMPESPPARSKRRRKLPVPGGTGGPKGQVPTPVPVTRGSGRGVKHVSAGNSSKRVPARRGAKK